MLWLIWQYDVDSDRKAVSTTISCFKFAVNLLFPLLYLHTILGNLL